MENEGEHKVSVIAVLSAVEYLSVKHGADREQSGLVMRELRGDPDTLFDRFSALMAKWEEKWKQADLRNKIDAQYYILVERLIESSKKMEYPCQCTWKIQRTRKH